MNEKELRKDILRILEYYETVENPDDTWSENRFISDFEYNGLTNDLIQLFKDYRNEKSPNSM